MNKPETTPAEKCAEYVLDTESEDFFENPDADHIYYYAMLHFYGKDHADQVLKEALAEDQNCGHKWHYMAEGKKAICENCEEESTITLKGIDRD